MPDSCLYEGLTNISTDPVHSLPQFSFFGILSSSPHPTHQPSLSRVLKVLPEVGGGQGGLACCDSWGHKESDTTERLN